jgi:hypothetical protein
MSNDENTAGDELQLEVIAQDESIGDSQTTEQSEGETEETQLNLETDEAEVGKLSPAEENAKRQEEAWLNKIIAGKAQVEDAPKWLHARLEGRLNATVKLPETEEVVKKLLEKEREAQEFKALQAQIPKLTPVQAKELTDRFNTLKAAGKVVALQAALDAMGLSQKVKEAEMRGMAKGRMSFPQSGQPSVRKPEQATIGGVPMDVLSDEKKWNEMIRTGDSFFEA